MVFPKPVPIVRSAVFTGAAKPKPVLIIAKRKDQ